MWGGAYVAIDDNLENFSRIEDLLGISTYDKFKYFENAKRKSYYDKIKFVRDNYNSWNHINVWDEAMEYFYAGNIDSVEYSSVEYSGYLVNHTQKLAIDLADYYEQSKYYDRDFYIECSIDAVPVLTETGDGARMAFFDGVSVDSTEELAGTWCGDLLQIVDDLPEEYKLINCCFAEIWSRASYCYHTFGINKDELVLSDDKGTCYKCGFFNISGKRIHVSYIKAEKIEKGIRYTSAPAVV
jgi:hypothetical protein